MVEFLALQIYKNQHAKIKLTYSKKEIRNWKMTATNLIEEIVPKTQKPYHLEVNLFWYGFLETVPRDLFSIATNLSILLIHSTFSVQVSLFQ